MTIDLKKSLIGIALELRSKKVLSFRSLAQAAGLSPETDFKKADLSGVDLRNEDLTGFDFTEADLRYADLRGARIEETILTKADLRGAIGVTTKLSASRPTRESNFTPRKVPSVYISTPLSGHPGLRNIARHIAISCGAFPVTAEYSAPGGDTVVQRIEREVSESDCIAFVIGPSYGKILLSDKENPEKLSIPEIEYNAAVKHRRPVFVFIMSRRYLIDLDSFSDPQNLKRQKDFKNKVKVGEDSRPRVYETIDSEEDFAVKFATALSHWVKRIHQFESESKKLTEPQVLPDPPSLRALPKYITSSMHVGRKAELQILNEWCRESDTDPVMLFEAIGGSGKSHLTWEWVTMHATKQRPWAGRFWYSFYEQGATMAEFVRHALAYTKGAEPAALKDLSAQDAAQALLQELDAKPFLLVLDGLERVLVAYNRIDADKIDDAKAEDATDQMADRQPRRTYLPGDEELLRALTAAAKSKILISTRLTPWALRNESLGTHNGVRVELLKGLIRDDAEALFRARGVKGNGPAIQDYLQTNCGNHPLVIGALAGLVMGYLKDRGNFDKWVDDADHGRKLNLAGLDLKQRRTHVLDEAIAALSPNATGVLQVMSLVSGRLDYDLLSQLNPMQSEASSLAVAIKELEAANLIQYDSSGKNFDLHPVVRRIADERMSKDEIDAHGKLVVDIFNTRPHMPYDQAETLNDVAPGLEIMRTQMRMGRLDEALKTFRGDLGNALRFNLSAGNVILELMRPFFPNGWEREIFVKDISDQSYLLNTVANFLTAVDPEQSARLQDQCIALELQQKDLRSAGVGISNRALILSDAGDLAQSTRLRWTSLRSARATRSSDQNYRAKIDLYSALILIGDANAEPLFADLIAMKPPGNRTIYREGELEVWRTTELFWTGRLNDAELQKAEAAAKRGRYHLVITEVLRTRAEWHLSRNEPALAIAPLNERIQRKRQARQKTNWEEAALALAQFRHRKDAPSARAEAERLTVAGLVSRELAELWYELGQRDRAIAIALKHHEWALADGEPYVFRYELDKTREFLTKLGAPLPPLRQHDPSKDERFPWEDDVEKMIAKLEAENAEKDKKKPKA